MKQTIEIEVPDGKKAVWKDGKVIFEDIKHDPPRFPKTWKEFCEFYPIFVNSSLSLLANQPSIDRVQPLISQNWRDCMSVLRYRLSYELNTLG